MKRLVAGALLAAILSYAGYLGWRVATERASVSARVDAIIARADPQELGLPARRVEWLVAVEDPTFWTNGGIDLASPGAGLTTISQGLGKHLFFTEFEPGLAKLELMVLTRFALYPEVDKDRTMKAFIASAYLGSKDGREVLGFSQGAQSWFGTSLDRVSDRQFLELVAMLVAPDQLKPGADDRAREERVRRIGLLLAGRCRPKGPRDVLLEGCA